MKFGVSITKTHPTRSSNNDHKASGEVSQRQPWSPLKATTSPTLSKCYISSQYGRACFKERIQSVPDRQIKGLNSSEVQKYACLVLPSLNAFTPTSDEAWACSTISRRVILGGLKRKFFRAHLNQHFFGRFVKNFRFCCGASPHNIVRKICQPIHFLLLRPIIENIV